MTITENGVIACPVDADGQHYAKCNETCPNWTACQCERMAARQSVNMDGVYALVEAFVLKIRSDYLNNYEDKRQLARYILSEDLYGMTGCDGEPILKRLAAEYEVLERERKAMRTLRELGEA